MRIRAVTTAARNAVVRAHGWLAAPFIAAVLVLAVPRPARADLMGICLAAADQWYADCRAESPNMITDFVCMWAGGVFIMICVIIGTIERFVEHLL